MRKKKNLSTAHIKLDTHLCKACWKCYDACQKDVFGKINILFGLHKHIIIANHDNCIGCLKCVKVCEHGAIKKQRQNDCRFLWHIIKRLSLLKKMIDSR